MRPNNKKNRLITEKLFPSTFSLLYSCFLLLSLLASSFLLLNSCNTTEPGRQPEITLNFEDASSTEVWMKLNTNGLDLPAEVSVYKNNKLSKNINLTSKDSVIYQDNLLPNKTYTFKAAVKLGDIELQSKSITSVTMDTTSHNFTWQTYTFGGVNGSSVLNDVAIINENDIWAVGEIHTAATDQFDSSGVWVQPYNAVHWNGQKWELKRIIVNFRGNNTFIPLEGIFALASDDIWLVGSLPIHGNGKNWKIYDVREITNSDLSLTKAWGSSSNNMYFVGRGGSIAHYNGSQWTKIESGTDADIQDIWGAEINNNTIIACAVSNIAVVGDREILLYNNGIKQTIFWPSGLRINSIWFQSLRQMFSCGDGIYKRIGTNWERQIALENTTYTEKIRGTSLNDIFVVGDFGFVTHYNGKNWKIYNELAVGLFYSLSYKNNVVVAVGERNAKGVIITGNRL